MAFQSFESVSSKLEETLSSLIDTAEAKIVKYREEGGVVGNGEVVLWGTRLASYLAQYQAMLLANRSMEELRSSGAETALVTAG